MPHLKVRGMDKKALIENSKEIIDGLTKIIKCDRNWFTIEHIDTEYIFDGKIVDGYTFVELFWFERTPEVKAMVGEFLTRMIKKINGNKDCCVIFFPLRGEDYCDNGEFF
ncbi:DUF1904 domain-containing protein [Fusobacterium sp.]|uniref:DUF1904 domain-containing protein n=1 Tax=Fusobacterium sp. TaxID=68766 RepID=UPI002604CFA7|nr:DUF1904 domain-containing protein [Fusobacterium sp.]